MAFEGITFDNQAANAKDDGGLFANLLSDGVLSGCTVAYSGNSISIGAGRLIVAGRLIRVPSTTTVAVSQTSGYARIRLRLDMTKISEEDDFEQIVTNVDYAASIGGFPALVQSDINAAGSYYDFALCVASLGSSGVTGIVTAPPAAGASLSGPITLSASNYGTQLPATGTQGRLFFKLRS